uniref:transketolase n=1 Tax=Chaetoceros debilis TaxID=122233 RepID=A0A7S3Q1S1_9STRA
MGGSTSPTLSPPHKRTKPCEPYDGPAFELKCVNNIRSLAADMPSAAKSGHPGAPMGCAPMAHLLWSEVMNYSPSNPEWWNRDRFVLSNGHACSLQYSMLHLAGYGLTIDDLKNFRQLGSLTPGHPENFVTKGVEVSTGPLGQGISNAVGFAVAERHFAATFNTEAHKIFDHHTYVICGDGCLQEGVSSEASSLAGHLGLGHLIVLYDDNNITIDGSTDLSFTEDVGKRYEAYGWQVLTVETVESDLKDLRAAVEAAKANTEQPTIIKIKTTIGKGSILEGSAATHGAPLKPDDMAQAKKGWGVSETPFTVADDVQKLYDDVSKANDAKFAAWEEMFAAYKAANAEKAGELERRFGRKLPDCILSGESLPKFDFAKDKPLATRQYSRDCIGAIAPVLPELMGGSADLTPSNLTAIACSGDFQKATPDGRYLRFGVREHGMAAICNGLFAYGGIRPFCATFLNFAGYALGSIRVSALSKFGVLYVMTHDSIGLGEDGPTHQPVEMIESLRSMPNINVYRPADSNEMSMAYKSALETHETPSVICCSRSGLPALENSSVEGASKGAYTILGSDIELASADLIIVGTGSEVGACLEAAKKLGESGLKVRMVSMPCQELFLQQSTEYQKSVLPGNIPTLSVEASAEHGWHRFSHGQIGVTRFGMSAPGKELFKKYGFTTENITQKGQALVDFYKNVGSVPDLMSRPFFNSFEGGIDH